MPAALRTPARIFLLALAALSLTLATASGASADATTSTPNSAPLRELPDLVLTPWLSSQTGNGNYERPSGTLALDGYANAGIAYGMLQEAARTGDMKYFKSAMKAFSWINRTRQPMNGVFYQMFSAAAFNLARESFGGRGEFRHIRAAWANKLRRFPYQKGRLGQQYHYNKNLIEALEVVELYNTGLRGNAPTAIVHNRGLAIKRALRVLNVLIPARVLPYTQSVGASAGWPFDTTMANMSDPPDNPPAYNALVAGMYARAYAELPVSMRTAKMQETAETMIRGVIARTAPDGDIAFDGRSQEQAWALSTSAYAAWSASSFVTGSERDMYLAFARRVVQRLENVHVTSASSFGFVLTPAAGCCDKQDMPPGQDHYYDVAKYSGLTALTMGWAILSRPTDWQDGDDAQLPADKPSDLVYEPGRGRFYQHRGTDIYWFLRMQSDYFDARDDMGVAVMKVRNADGSWTDVVPPRPYTGGHFKPADPAGPCLVYKNGCGYLELHGGTPSGAGYQFDAVWRTPRRTVIREGQASVTPTARGLRLSWSGQAGDIFKIDNFLPKARCQSGGVSSPGLTVTVAGQNNCSLSKGYFAGGSRVDLRRIHSVTTPQGGGVDVTYAATAN